MPTLPGRETDYAAGDEATAPADGAEGVEAALQAGTRAVGVSGLGGASRALFVAELSRAASGLLVAVVPDESGADAFERDLRLFLGSDASETRPRVLRVPADELLPYDDLSPDRETTRQRLRGLHHLLEGTGARVLVVSVRALARRVLPRSVVQGRTLRLAKGRDIALDVLRNALVSAGYENVPLVEDPGSFAVRGGIADVFSPVCTRPARLEFFGDTLESIRFFDPETQRTLAETNELPVCPAREILFDGESRAAATASIRAAADEVHKPSSKVRELLDDVEQGIAGFGLEALLPGFHARGLGTLWDYLPGDALLVLDDPPELERVLRMLDEDLQQDFRAARDRGDLALEPAAHFVPADETLSRLAGARRVELQHLVLGAGMPAPERAPATEQPDGPADEQGPESLRRAAEGLGGAPLVARFRTEPTASIRGEILSHHGELGALEPLAARLAAWRSDGIAAVVACHSAGQAGKLRRMLLDRELMAKTTAAPLPARLRDVYDPSVYAHLVEAEISAGFVDRARGVALVSDADVFGERAERKVRRVRAEQPFVARFRDLKEGDLVVHVEHGIARYMGLAKLAVRGCDADFLVLHFAGKDKLYLPVHRLRQIQKYAGGDPEKVRLDSLQSNAFERRKARVKEELLRMAAELLELYAERKAHPGHAFAAPDALYRQFEADFEFEETPDQEKAVEAVLADMRRPEPMDRLVCGDVGYGKTEVAMRAAFKAVEDRKQVAVLVPTTVLALQHFHTFSRRMKDYPVVVEMISRFRDARQVRDVLRRTAEGKVDILVGTHRLLSRDVSFRDLGLVVVDEEHRFGVKHKEALKNLRRLVDVLVLTATPIPRTLHMSLMGARDMSIIATPPADRRAIRTFVTKFDPAVVREAVERELARGGQVYFVHNRVGSIGALAKFVSEQVPGARVAVAHGQMPDGRLEEIMGDFVERRYDVLVCTTIIESGLDIPSANTMLVNRADAFGLAQLYQIRGRVGRSRERAYCYLFVPARRPVGKEARQRLEVLQQFTELGAGFHIASHDLEIRGAGNLLGPDQSGNIAAVGFDLYTELMEQAVRELRGEPAREEVEPDVSLAIPALIPEAYMPEMTQRLLFYKRLAQASDEEELERVRAEIVDRYGEPPGEVDNLCRLMSLKADMRRLRLRALESGPGRLVVTLGPGADLDPVATARLVARSTEGLRLTPDMKLVYPVDAARTPSDLLAAAERVMRALHGIRTGG